MTPDKDAEIARLRRELEYAIEAARENGAERDELARALGAEVATTQRLMAALRDMAEAARLGKNPGGFSRMWFQLEEALKRADAALASGNGDGK